ncbi:MAG: hypothetical protein WBN75_07470 [Verrucomicrobiia bacterium]
MSIFKPKNPAEMTAQASNPEAIVLGDGRRPPGVDTGRGAGAGGSPVDISFVIMRLMVPNLPV